MNKSLRTAKSSINDEEWQVRVELAACYRLFVKFGWTDLIFTHLSARVPGHPDQYLINPYGLLFNEITASNLIKVDLEGNLISGDYPYNNAGHAIHSAMLRGRPDMNVFLHSHTRAGIAVSCMKEGLLPLSQQASEVRDLVAYHKYDVVSEKNLAECEALGRDLPKGKWLMIMHNHGLLSAGRTISEAFYYLYVLEIACKVQVDVMASGAEMIFPDEQVQIDVAKNSSPPEDGLEDAVTRSWAALMRTLDKEDSSYRQ